MTRRGLDWAAALLLTGVLSGPAGAASDVREIGPHASLCAEINTLTPGQELALRPGQYGGPCAVRRGGAPGRPITIRAAVPEERPLMVYHGRGANVLDVHADHVVIRGLTIGPTQRGVDGVRVFSRHDVIIEDCEFSGLGGIAIAATHRSMTGLVARGNVIRGSQATAMYFGCHDGARCAITGLLVEGNYIHGVRAPTPEIGYGIQVKLNSVAIIRDNVIIDTKGPGIMVYGARDADRVSVVERNFLMGSHTSSGLVLGGGPALARNNIAVHNAEAGIALEDYGTRGLLRGVVVAHNTTYGNRGAGIEVPTGRLPEVTLVNNASHSPADAAPLPLERPGVTATGNVDCSRGRCFTDPAALDFSPSPDSLLLGAGADGDGRLVPLGDFFGAPRSRKPTAGAVESGRGPVRLPSRP